MVEFGMWIVDHEQSGFANLEREIDVVKGN